MSKMINNIRSYLLYKRKLDVSPLSVVEKLNYHPYDFLTEYKISVEYKIEGYCKPKDLFHIKENVIHQLRKDLYEDIEREVLLLERMIHEKEYEKAQECLSKIKKEVWG